MSGITGIYITGNELKIEKETLVKMRDVLIHRGPDDEGLYISKDKKTGLGFRRLATIDLSKKANQPIANQDKTIQLVFDGVIYNFQEIKEELIKKGYKFKSKADSEVLLCLYEEKGRDCLNDLNGMFSFVIWDEKKKEIFAARDRLGIKPFYYYYQEGVFLFGSEIKAILANPLVKKEPNLEGISHYLTFACTPAPFTLFKNIYKIPAAHYLTLNKTGCLDIQRYWNPLKNQISVSKNEQEEFYIKETRRLLKNSIKKQVISDVSVGCFLSGGIDSSTNAVVMSEAIQEPIKTFSISYKDYPEFNEFEYSRKINNLIQAKGYEVQAGPEEFLQWIELMKKNMDDPNGDCVSFPVYYIAKMLKENNVLMSQVGEGSDELFSGYDRDIFFYKLYQKFWRFAEKLPFLIRVIPYYISKIIPLRLFSVPKKEFLRRLANGKPLFYGGANAFPAEEKQFLFSSLFKKQIPFNVSDKVIENIYKDFKSDNFDFFQKYLYLELNLRLPELLLMRVDKMVSMNSIETRAPFLDYQLVELAASIPQELKLKNDTSKYILKKAVEEIIPLDIIYRKKKGFGVPFSQWLKENKKVKETMINIIQNSEIKKLDIFDFNYINKLIDNHLNGTSNNAFEIWILVTLFLWYDNWIVS